MLEYPASIVGLSRGTLRQRNYVKTFHQTDHNTRRSSCDIFFLCLHLDQTSQTPSYLWLRPRTFPSVVSLPSLKSNQVRSSQGSSYWILVLGAIVVLLVSIYFKGSLSNELVWRARVAELEAKIQIAEQKSQKANVIIKNRVITKTKIVREKQIVIQEKIREVEKKINEKCEIDPAVIEIHNQAAGTPGDAK